MAMMVEVQAPDGWICEVLEVSPGGFSPRRWKLGAGHVVGPRPNDPSGGLRAYKFRSATEAMMTAYRERLQRDALRSFAATQRLRARG